MVRTSIFRWFPVTSTYSHLDTVSSSHGLYRNLLSRTWVLSAMRYGVRPFYHNNSFIPRSSPPPTLCSAISSALRRRSRRDSLSSCRSLIGYQLLATSSIPFSLPTQSGRPLLSSLLSSASALSFSPTLKPDFPPFSCFSVTYRSTISILL